MVVRSAAVTEELCVWHFWTVQLCELADGAPGAGVLAALSWSCLMHSTPSCHPCSQERAHLHNPPVPFLHRETEEGVGRNTQMRILAGAPEQGCAAALGFSFCVSALLPGPKTAPVGGLAPHNTNHCHESPFGVTGFDLLLAAQSQAANLKVWSSFFGIVSEQPSRERSFIPKGIFFYFIEKALVCCCCFPKNDLKTFDIWKLSRYDQTDKSHR